MMHLDTNDQLAIQVVAAIQTGDNVALQKLLQDHPALASARIGGKDAVCGRETARSLLHVATDWPGHFPNGPAVVAVLIAAGADVNARFLGPHTETPLHWAASSDDVAVLDLLLDAGADIEAPGGVMGNGTPIADAAAFGQWQAARRLVERGARTTLWQSAALGLTDSMSMQFAADPPPDAKEITNAFWCACHGGQRASAERLLAEGADLNWIGHDRLTPLEAARRSGAEVLAAWLVEQGARTSGDQA